MNKGETFLLPEYELQTNTTVASAIASGNQFGNKQSKNIFASKVWTGLTPYDTPRKTPILYHRGSWQAINRDDPEADPPNDPFPTRNYIRYEQHGLGWDEAGGEIRMPRCILYNYRLAPASATGTWADVGTSFDLVPSYWIGTLTSQLEAKRVLTASLNDQQGYGGCFIASAIPGYDTQSDDAYVAADPAGYGSIVDYRRLIDATRFTGGHLLVLNCVVSFDGSLGGTGYFKMTGASGVKTAGYWGTSARTDYDIAAWIASYARFASLKQYVYIRERRDTAGITTDSATATAHIQSVIGGALSGYGVTIRNGVEATVDIGSTIEADVASWLSGLPD